MEYLKNTFLYKLLQTKKKMVHAVRKDFQEVGITHENYITLHFIYENPGITQSELADINDKDRNVIVKTIDKLENMGLVNRIRSKDDRRAFTLQVTDDGVRIIDEYWDRIILRQKEALGNLSEDEQKTLVELLDKVNN